MISEETIKTLGREMIIRCRWWRKEIGLSSVEVIQDKDAMNIF